MNLASRCGLSQTSLSQIESDIKIPHDKNLDKICKVLQVTRIGLYLLATDESELPIAKRDTFRILRPAIVELFTY